MLAPEFVQNALLAGSPIALASGLLGYLLLLRRQVFAADALSHAAFTGAVAAALLGVDLRAGLVVATLAFALALSGLGGRARADDAAIGTALAWVLGVGALLLALVATGAGGGDGALAARSLFGSIFGLTRGDSELAAAVASGLIAALAVIVRPLLFATLDPAVAASQGVPVRLLGVAFLLMLGLDTAEATQAVGALLLLGLLTAPAGAAHRLTADPYRGLLLAAGFALGATWAGILLSYTIPPLPPSSAIIGVASAIYALSFASPGARPARRPGRRAASARPGDVG